MSLLLATRLKNMLPATFTVSLKNISINGNKKGCSGFIEHQGVFVYVNTEPCGHLGHMYRTAKNAKDFEGGRNMWAKSDADLVAGITSLLLHV